MVKVLVALKEGEPLSTTRTLTTFVVRAWATSGRQLNRAWLLSSCDSVAFVGAAVKVNVKVCEIDRVERTTRYAGERWRSGGGLLSGRVEGKKKEPSKNCVTYEAAAHGIFLINR